MTLSANYTIVNSSGIAQSLVDQVQALADYALHAWGALLAGDATINIKLSFLDTTSSGRAQGGNETSFFLGARNGLSVYEPGTAYELRTGLQVGGSGADIHIQIARNYLLNELFIDPSPGTSNDIPVNKTDGLSVLLHEIGHGLGMIGYWQEATNTWQSNANTVYDTRLSLIGGEAYFDGPNVRAFYGAAVPLTNNNYAHYGNTNAYPGTSSDPLTGLMNGIVFYEGYRYSISNLDLSILADLGYGTIRDDIFDNSMMHVFTGGAGNDTYRVHAQSDIIRENAGQGTDTAIADTGYYLWGDVENLVLAAGAGDIFGVGNELANDITGNEGSNLLIAGAGDDVEHGGGGIDVLYGQDGNDQMFGDAGNDVLIAGLGNDVLDGGTGGDSLYGEDGNDTLTGGTSFEFDQLVGGNGDDILHGDSGMGDFDYLYGNAGNDTFYVDTPADLVFEQPGEGTDTVFANIVGAGYYLYDNIENLTLLGNTPFGVGNALANTLIGNGISNYLLGGGGNDTLNGKGGNDVLFGEGGADTFVFEHGTGGDVIGDFLAGTDKIDLHAFGFANFQAVQNSMHEVNGTTAIDLGGGDFIVINGVASASFHAGDFIL